MENRWLRAVKNHCKASKIHSSGDMRPGHKKGKVRKTDERIGELYGEFLRIRTLVSGIKCHLQGFLDLWNIYLISESEIKQVLQAALEKICF